MCDNPPSFSIGQKVVCIKTFDKAPYVFKPIKKETILTIRKKEFADVWHYCFEEIVNKTRKFIEGYSEPMYEQGFFAPIIETYANISVEIALSMVEEKNQVDKIIVPEIVNN